MCKYVPAVAQTHRITSCEAVADVADQSASHEISQVPERWPRIRGNRMGQLDGVAATRGQAAILRLWKPGISLKIRASSRSCHTKLKEYETASALIA